jgi:HD superfamily phosphohydrolase
MFQQVYFHKTSRASEWMLARALARVGELMADGTRVPGVPGALEALIRDNDCSLSEYLTLDDNVLWVALRGFQEASDPLLSDLARRLCSRRLFKTIGLYAELSQPHERQRCLEVARDIARAQGLHPNVHVGLDAASDQPFDDQDESLSVVYPGGRERRPREVSFLLGRLSGERLERVRHIVAPEIRDAVKRAIEP